VNPTKLSQYQIGAGPDTVLLLHGFLGSGKNLTTLAKRLSAQHPTLSIIVPDLTGHGASPGLPDHASLADLAGDVLDLCQDRSGPYWVIGHSLGGRVALRLSERAPKLARVALLDISPSPMLLAQSETHLITRLLSRAPGAAPTREVFRVYFREAGLSEALNNWLLMNLTQRDEQYVWRIDREALAALLDRMNQEDLWSAAEALARQDKLWSINGERSPYVSHEDALRLFRVGAHVKTLPDAGHFVHVDALDALLRALLDFLPR
jgi:esterase